MANTALKTKLDSSAALTGPPPENHEVFRVTFGQQQLLWDARAPLGLGFPFQWALERTALGIRVRRLDAPTGQVTLGSVKEFTFPDPRKFLHIPLGEGDAPPLTVQAVIGDSNCALVESEWVHF